MITPAYSITATERVLPKMALDFTTATLDAGTITSNTSYKLSGAWKTSSFATAINGATAVTQASGTLPTVTQARLGSDGTNFLNGILQKIQYYPQRLINNEVQAFSK
jgi:hypothetical protein